MRHLLISSLAVAAFGVTLMGATTADAGQGWVTSGWVDPNNNNFPVTTSRGFKAVMWTNWGSLGITLANNITGTKVVSGQSDNALCTAQQCDTSFWAWTECSDFSVITGNEANGAKPNSDWSATNDVGTYGAGYFYANGTAASSDPGVCPAGTNYLAGGLWVYDY
jgi:hypothetical protein